MERIHWRPHCSSPSNKTDHLSVNNVFLLDFPRRKYPLSANKNMNWADIIKYITVPIYIYTYSLLIFFIGRNYRKASVYWSGIKLQLILSSVTESGALLPKGFPYTLTVPTTFAIKSNQITTGKMNNYQVLKFESLWLLYRLKLST